MSVRVVFEAWDDLERDIFLVKALFELCDECITFREEGREAAGRVLIQYSARAVSTLIFLSADRGS